MNESDYQTLLNGLHYLLYSGQVSESDYLSAYAALDHASLASQAMLNEYGADWNEF